MNKVVINGCYGGFGLSRKAAERLLELGLQDSELEHDVNREESYASYYPNVPRHHPLLVQVVEELGEESFGDFAKLEIVEIHGDLYSIGDYDGMESIETPNTHEWISCKD